MELKHSGPGGTTSFAKRRPAKVWRQTADASWAAAAAADGGPARPGARRHLGKYRAQQWPRSRRRGQKALTRRHRDGWRQTWSRVPRHGIFSQYRLLQSWINLGRRILFPILESSEFKGPSGQISVAWKWNCVWFLKFECNLFNHKWF